jgi:DtxR family transcriptional regulator, Mn-dependent transcriptional regulator
MALDHPTKLHGHQKNKISKEMYLKTIFLFKEEFGKDPKSVDIGKELHLSKGSVSEQLKKLAEEGVISYESYKPITLTEVGLQHAKNVVRKYLTIKQFLTEFLNIDTNKAHEEACNLEHGFSDESIAKLNILMKATKK